MSHALSCVSLVFSVFIESTYCVHVVVHACPGESECGSPWCVCAVLSTSLWAPLLGTAIVSMSLKVCAGESS